MKNIGVEVDGDSDYESTERKYFSGIMKIPVLSRKEELDCANASISGDLEARKKLLRHNLRLVIKISRDFRGLLPFMDLVCHGNEGLSIAVERFDPTKGSKFSNYASWWIKQSIRLGISKNRRTIRIPISTDNKRRKVQKAVDKLAGKLDRPPTIEEISNETDYTPRQVKAMLRIDSSNTVSLDEKIENDPDSKTYFDIVKHLGNEEDFERAQLQDMVKSLEEAIKILSEREKEIIHLRFGLNGHEPLTLEETGKIVGLKRERVRQVEDIVLQKLKFALKDL